MCFNHSLSLGFPTSCWKWIAQYSVVAVSVRRLQPLIAQRLPRYLAATPGASMAFRTV